jgi:hypothetical protein
LRLKGSEQSALALPKTAISPDMRTKSGTPTDDSPDSDPQLKQIIEAWPSLAPEVRAAILCLIEERQQ